jgi:hypothetical protein
MDTFAPELSKFWLAEATPKGGEPAQAADEEARRDNAALKALADLVSAARSIV